MVGPYMRLFRLGLRMYCGAMLHHQVLVYGIKYSNGTELTYSSCILPHHGLCIYTWYTDSLRWPPWWRPTPLHSTQINKAYNQIWEYYVHDVIFQTISKSVHNAYIAIELKFPYIMSPTQIPFFHHLVRWGSLFHAFCFYWPPPCY